MHLLSRGTDGIQITAFDGELPPYAILSHTWDGENEVLYQDLKSGSYDSLRKPGVAKLEFCLERAKKDDIGYVWIDSCCIDRSNLPELGRSINKMFQYYMGAEVCYVYLTDVQYSGWRTQLYASRWFTRGWTLQELIAPSKLLFFCMDTAGTQLSLSKVPRKGNDERFVTVAEVLYHDEALRPLTPADTPHHQLDASHEHLREKTFYDQLNVQQDPAPKRWHDTRLIGSKEYLSRELLEITKIDLRSPLKDVPIAKRFEWSLSRQTTEPEDMSYCLLGILEVPLVANYGEGHKVAHERLREAIEKEHGKKTAREIDRILASRVDDTLTLQEVRSTLSFRGMNVRRATIANPYSDTCSWLLTNPDFKAWEDRQLQFLWIKGKAGSGKSTLMRYADLSHQSTRVSFYFNARGEALESSVEGMYRSLLYQFIDQVPSTRRSVNEHLQREKSYTAASILNMHILKAVFGTAVHSLTEPVHCFIDALDECKETEAQSMIHFLEDISFRSNLYICFASRYYPSITIKSTELLLESQEAQSQDLRNYVNGRLSAELDLRNMVIQKANGVFFWTVLVVNLLNEEASDGRVYNLRRRLTELPSELNTLLRQIVTRSDHLSEFRYALQWLVYAKRPLSAQEYYTAIVTGLDTLDPSDECYCPLAWADENVTIEQITRFVASTSRGLAELTRGSRPTVQFIHESVRDFLIRHKGLHELLPSCEIELGCWVHDELKTLCYRYLTSRNISSKIVSRGHHFISETSFARYTATFVLQHAEEAAELIAQDTFIGEFGSHSSEWLTHFTDFHLQLADFGDVSMWHRRLGVVDALICGGCIRLLGAAQRSGLNFKEIGNEVMYMAIEKNMPNILSTLLQCGMDPQAMRDLSYYDGNDAETPMTTAVRLGNPEILSLLLQTGADAQASARSGVSALSTAVLQGDVQVMKLLLDSASSLTPSGLSEALLTACNLEEHDLRCWCRSNAGEDLTKIAEMLLQEGADPNCRDVDGHTAIVCAAEHGNMILLDLLLNHGADVKAVDAEACAVLFQAVQQSKAAPIGSRSLKHSVSAADSLMHNSKAGRFIYLGDKLQDDSGRGRKLTDVQGNSQIIPQLLVAEARGPEVLSRKRKADVLSKRHDCSSDAQEQQCVAPGLSDMSKSQDETATVQAHKKRRVHLQGTSVDGSCEAFRFDMATM